MVDDISLATLGPSRKINFSQFFRFHVFIFGGRHVSELPACEITNFAKRHFAARIVFVTNWLPVRVLDEPITPICVIFRCASFWSKNIFGFGMAENATNAKFSIFKFYTWREAL